MSEITQLAVVETKQAIWDFDPSLPENRLVIGGLDVIAMIRTLVVKVYLTSSHLRPTSDQSRSDSSLRSAQGVVRKAAM